MEGWCCYSQCFLLQGTKETTCPFKTRTNEDMVIAAIDPQEGRRHICFGSCLPEGVDRWGSYTVRNEANVMRNSLERTTTICMTLFAQTDMNVYFPNVYLFDQKPSKTQELLATMCVCVPEFRAAIFASRTMRVFSVLWSHTSLKMCYTHKCERPHQLHIFNHNQSLWVPVHTQAHSLKQINLAFVLLSTSQPPLSQRSRNGMPTAASEGGEKIETRWMEVGYRLLTRPIFHSPKPD